MELGSVNQRNKVKKQSGNSNAVSNANTTGGNGQKKNPPKNGPGFKPGNSAKAAAKSGSGPAAAKGYCFNCKDPDHWSNKYPLPKQPKNVASLNECVVEAEWQDGK